MDPVSETGLPFQYIKTPHYIWQTQIFKSKWWKFYDTQT